jgi:shikimate dehydrogenase
MRVARFRKACVIGWPILHSRSPLVHRYWLAKYAIPGDYRREAVAPENLSDFVEQMRTHGYCGANVTIPHKESALALCEHATELAKRIGAVNTLWFESGRLWGDNTDVSGFLSNLDDRTPGWDSQCGHAVILGAGGAARAVLAGLAMRKISDVTILNRSIDHARHLAEVARDWGFANLEVRRLETEGKAFAGANLLVNTTSLGMSGQPALHLDIAGLSVNAVVNDIVYTPLETQLLTSAQGCGFRTASGLGMLLFQAVPGFAHWFGIKPEVDQELRSRIEGDIRRSRE